MALRLGTPTFLTPCVDIGLTADVCVRRRRVRAVRPPTPVVCLSCFAGLWLASKCSSGAATRDLPAVQRTIDLHLGCVCLAALTLALSIVLCLTLGPPIARRVAHSEYDDDEELEKQGTDAHLFYNAATYRWRPARVRARDPFCSARLRCARAATRSNRRRRPKAQAARRNCDPIVQQVRRSVVRRCRVDK